jgi:UDP-N-acetylglucosamine 2-epimerase (non-hydrolysing)
MKLKSALKVMTIVGTRPELIRLSRVIAKLDSHLNHILVHTGQNYAYELNEVFFQELEIRNPDYLLDVETTSLGKVLGETLINIEPILQKEKPDAVLILGDTNSCIASIMAKRLHIPMYHMEAGNRSFDLNVPEEINRRMIDHIADFNLVYTENSRRHLLSEGLPHRQIYLTGSPMNEVLRYYSDKIKNSNILASLSLESQSYFVVSMHREENVDNPVILKTIVSILNQLVDNYDLPVIVTTHPRTKKRLDSRNDLKLNKKISFIEPFGFFDYIKLQKNALCVISDSGTISEESSILEFPAITLRNSMERPEALDAGSLILTGFDIPTVMDSISLVTSQRMNLTNNSSVPDEYKITNTSQRVVNLIMGTAKLSNIWSGINSKFPDLPT